jgi:hypothetical protein
MILRVSRRSSALYSLRGVFVAAWPDCNIFDDISEMPGNSKPRAIGAASLGLPPGITLTSHRAQMQQRGNDDARASA